jgi:hypothetical protein
MHCVPRGTVTPLRFLLHSLILVRKRALLMQNAASQWLAAEERDFCRINPPFWERFIKNYTF